MGHVLDRPDQLPLQGDAPSSGIFAPTLRHHDGLFYLVTTNIGEIAKGQLIVHAADPTGPWSSPVHVPGTPGIDPDLVWDEDGTCHLTWRSWGPDGSRIRSLPINPLTGEHLGASCDLWQGTGMRDAEGPHLYRRDGWWYLLLAEGGTGAGHCVTIARSRTLAGPQDWEECPHNPVLTHRSTDHPVQATGHADLVTLADGGSAMVHLGTRPAGTFPGFHVNGRETFLVGIDWVDGWPVVDEDRYSPDATGRPLPDHSFSDDLRGAPGPVVDDGGAWDLPPRWLDLGWLAHGALTRDDDGRTVLTAPEATPQPGAAPATADPTPPLLAVRCRDAEWRAQASLSPAPGAVAELCLYLDPSHHASVRLEGNRAVAVVRIGPLEQELGAVDLPADSPTPRTPWIAAVRPTNAPFTQSGPDQVVLGVTGPDGDVELAHLDGRYLSTEVASGFTGRVVGVRALRGATVIEGFRYATS